MTKVKVKKLIPKGSSNTDQEALTDLFEQMTGTKDADLAVIFPKFVSVMNLLRKFYKLYSLLASINIFAETFSEYVWIDEINLFLKDIITQCNLIPDKEYKEDLFEQELIDNGIDKNKIKEHINHLYRQVKTSQVIKKIMITSANLAPFKIHLSLDTPSDSFIMREPGSIFMPLSFSTLDLKIIWNYNVEPKCKKFVLSILQHTFKLSYNIYDIIYSPDVDIAEFSSVLISTITKLRKQIPRCDRAFDVIENSVNMLRSNFKDYFRVSVESENPASILESFIVDVANTQKANPTIVQQFRRITAFMKKNAANNKDPRVKKLFSMLNSQFTKIDDELKVDTTINETEEPILEETENNISEQYQEEEILPEQPEEEQALPEQILPEQPEEEHALPEQPITENIYNLENTIKNKCCKNE
jgi:hypothetical protein